MCVCVFFCCLKCVNKEKERKKEKEQQQQQQQHQTKHAQLSRIG